MSQDALSHISLEERETQCNSVKKERLGEREREREERERRGGDIFIDAG